MATREPRKVKGEGSLGRTQRVLAKRGSENAFLESYRPEDSMFTSRAEMARVERRLKLADKSLDELRAKRNEVVAFYRDRMATQRYQENGIMRYGDKFDQYMEAMQSVTAVIDNLIYRKGGMF